MAEMANRTRASRAFSDPSSSATIAPTTIQQESSQTTDNNIQSNSRPRSSSLSEGTVISRTTHPNSIFQRSLVPAQYFNDNSASAEIDPRLETDDQIGYNTILDRLIAIGYPAEWRSQIAPFVLAVTRGELDVQNIMADATLTEEFRDLIYNFFMKIYWFTSTTRLSNITGRPEFLASAHGHDGQSGVVLPLLPAPQALFAPINGSFDGNLYDRGNNIYPTSALIDFLLQHFNNPAFSDVLVTTSVRGQHRELYLHGFTLSQSPLLEAHVNRNRDAMSFDEQGRIKVNLESNLPYLSTSILVDSLRCLYGITAEQAILDRFSAIDAISTTNGVWKMADRLRVVVQFYLAGLFLGLQNLVDTSFTAFRQELHYGNFEFALAFALTNIKSLADHNPHDSAWYRSKLEGTYMDLGSGIYGHASELLLIECMIFIVKQLPAYLALDVNAAISPALGAFMLADDIESNLNPIEPEANGEVVFGTMDQWYLVHSRLSTILLSTPFAILSHICGKLHLAAGNFDVVELVQTRNLRTARYIEEVAEKRGLGITVSVGEATLVGIPPVMFAKGVLEDRAKWFEKVVGEGRVERVWMGPVSDEEDDGLGVHWANQME